MGQHMESPRPRLLQFAVSSLSRGACHMPGSAKAFRA